MIAQTSRRRVQRPLLSYMLTDAGVKVPNNGQVGRLIDRLALLLGVHPADIPYTLTPEWDARIREVLPQLRDFHRMTLPKMRRQLPLLARAPAPAPVPQEQLDAQLRTARAEMLAQLQAQFDERVRQEADARVAARTAKLDRWEQDLQELELRLRARSASVVELMSYEEFQIVRSVLHPDRAPPDRAEKYARAFQIFARLEGSVNRNLPADALRKLGWEHMAPFRRNGARVSP